MYLVPKRCLCVCLSLPSFFPLLFLFFFHCVCMYVCVFMLQGGLLLEVELLASLLVACCTIYAIVYTVYILPHFSPFHLLKLQRTILFLVLNPILYMQNIGLARRKLMGSNITCSLVFKHFKTMESFFFFVQIGSCMEANLYNKSKDSCFE